MRHRTYGRRPSLSRRPAPAAWLVEYKERPHLCKTNITPGTSPDEASPMNVLQLPAGVIVAAAGLLVWIGCEPAQTKISPTTKTALAKPEPEGPGRSEKELRVELAKAKKKAKQKKN